MNVQAQVSASGYLHRGYADSFAEMGTTRELSHCGGWLVERVIPGSDFLDAMGCYPIFACRQWTSLPLDLTPLADQLVSLSLVADPFGEFTEDDLGRWFDLVRPYKQHYVTDLSRWVDHRMPRRHRRNTASALESVQLETCSEPLHMLEDWITLYDQLIERHGITGIKAFSRESFRKQLGVPGLVMFKASADGHVVGLHLWYVQGDVAYGHLGATSARGYELMTSYALYWYAIEQLRGCVRWLDLGGEPDVSEAGSRDGLRQFKKGWSTGVRQAYLCGRIFQPDVYARLVSRNGIGSTSYFPGYRRSEHADARV
jgi:hypothetical protein